MGPGSGEPVVRVRGLRKSYGPQEVLGGIDLDVPAGTILGYIGPNGAGKTTTVRILVGLLDEFEGEVSVAGHDPRREPTRVKASVGYVPENAVLYESLTVAETLLFVGRLHGLEDEAIRGRADEMLEALDLRTRLATRVSTLSKGMRQKLLLIAALLHAPPVLFLDEPLTGLDVNASILVKELLRRLADDGRTIFYCSHVMDVVERICDEIAVIDGGRVVARGTYEELAAQRGGGTLETIFAGLTSTGDPADRLERLVRAVGPPPAAAGGGPTAG